MARKRTIKATTEATPEAPLEIAPTAPQADLHTGDTDAGPAEGRTTGQFIPGKTQTYNLPTGSSRTDN